MKIGHLSILFLLLLASCKKDVPPSIAFKTGAGYTSADLTCSPGQSILVGISAAAGSDDLSLLYTEVAFDGANAPMLVSRIWMTNDEHKKCDKDITVTTRSQQGTERWVFDINDKDGRISKVELRITVQ